MKEILLDEAGYAQYKEEVTKLQKKLEDNAYAGSEAYTDLGGDGWHDNFAYEEIMRNDKKLANDLMKMKEEEQYIKVIKKKKKEELIDLEDTVEVEFTYENGEKDIDEIQLTGKYLPDLDSDIQEVTLNSPLGKAIYNQKVGYQTEYTVNEKRIVVRILKKV